MTFSTWLVQPRLTVVSGQVDSELLRIREILDHKVLVDGRSDLEALFGKLLALAETHPPTPKTLDLVGHAVAGTAALQLGDWVIDTARPGVTAFFRELADNDVLPRLGIHAVRLLGCRTAETAQARRTICTLSDVLGLEVHGTAGILFANHYNAAGFDDAWRFLLVAASDLRRAQAASANVAGQASPRSLDLDAIPAVGIDTQPPWPCRLADAHTTRAVLRLIRRNEGAAMPGLLAQPRCELAIPAANRTTYHRLQIVLDGDFVRVYPDGEDQPGVLYPVTDPHLLHILVDKLPPLAVPSDQRDTAHRTPIAY